MKYVYTVWFRNQRLASDDPDRDWPACFLIEAPDESAAQGWGDHLAVRYASGRGEDRVSSTVEPLAASKLRGAHDLPQVAYGHEANDDEIGW